MANDEMDNAEDLEVLEGPNPQKVSDTGPERQYSEQVRHENYLGQFEVVQALVQRLLSDFAEQGFSKADKADAKEVIERLTERAARVLLGRTRSAKPVRNWNQPGGIDKWLSETLPMSATDPMQRVQTALVQCLGEYVDVMNVAANPVMLREQWESQLLQVIRKWTLLLMGVSPAYVETMLVYDEKRIPEKDWQPE